MEIQQIDTMISSFNAFDAKEVGPLILTWAMFLSLINSLPEKEENNLLTVHVYTLHTLFYYL